MRTPDGNAVLVNALSSSLRSTLNGLDTAPDLIRRVLEEGSWRSFTTPRGEEVEHTTFESFLTTPPSKGLGKTVAQIVKVAGEDPETLKLLAQELGTPPEDLRLRMRSKESYSTVEQDARSFGSYANSGGWMFGLMVARCVQPQNVEATHKASSEDKISAKKFALMAGTSAVRVMRFYRAWERAAEAGVVPSPGLLTPGQEIELPEPGLWGEYFTKYEQSSDRRESIALQAEIAGTSYNQAVRVAENPAALRTAILGDPKTAEAARAALADRMQDDVELQARLAQTIVQTPDLRKAVTAESRRVEHVALLRRAIDSGTVKTPAGQIIELPEDVKKKVAEHLTDIENAPAQSESGEAYEAFRQIVTETIEANPQLLVSERRHKLYGRIQKAAKAFSDLDPKEVEKLGEDDLVQTLEEIQEVIGDLLSNARRNRRPLRSVNSES